MVFLKASLSTRSFSGPCLILAAFFFFQSGCPSPVHATAVEWSSEEREWLLALTYPDHRVGDFGKDVPAADRGLLERFRPRIFVSPRGLLPVDFYRFYLPRTVVRDLVMDGRIIKKAPSRDFLQKIERERRFYLDYTGPALPCTECDGYVGVGYGRVYREVATFRLRKGHTESVPVIILKYSFAFPYSGLSALLGPFREFFARLISDPWKWHELDIHGAVHIVLNERKVPMILLLAQHNYFRSYIINREVFPAPDGRILICFAERSNEPYPCPDGKSPSLYRTVGSPVDMAYVLDGKDRPFISGMDRVYGPASGAREVRYRLEFLPDRDPLYVSWIPLGDRKALPFIGDFYTSGPPGMDLNTWPELKKYSDIMQFWYLRDGDPEDALLVKRAFKSFTDVDFEGLLLHNGSRIYKTLVEEGYLSHSTP